MKLLISLLFLSVSAICAEHRSVVRDEKIIDRDCTLIEINVSRHTSHDRHPSWSPDGQFFVFESDRTGKWAIYKFNIHGEPVEIIIRDAFNNRTPSFHPDGNRILFESDRSGKMELYLMDLRDRSISKIIHKDHFSAAQQFGVISPDGFYLAFTSSPAEIRTHFNIFLLNLHTEELQQITFDSTRSLYPAWSSDSQYLVFFSRRDTKGESDELYRLVMRDKSLTRLTNNQLHDFCPTWRGSSSVYFARTLQNGKPELFGLNLNNNIEHRLTINEEVDTEPSVSPDGKTLLWAGYRNGNFEILKAVLKN